MDSQRCEASTKLSLSPLPRWQSGFRYFRSCDVVRRRIWVARVRILLNTQEGFVLCRVVVFQAGNMVQEISLKGFVPVLLLSAVRGILATPSWIGCH
jgi:hypothetical protein